MPRSFTVPREGEGGGSVDGTAEEGVGIYVDAEATSDPSAA